ncbi:uncharacterized protein TNCV_434091 [Trichonephila clavipes]|nr:uncharacterized protein TNCV_434091 [Trichonephila clavipes]
MPILGAMDEQLKALLEEASSLRKCGERKQVCPAAPVSVPASPVSVKLYTYDGKTNWEVYKIQFGIISEANEWTEDVKAYQLVASLRGEAAEVLQTLTDTELLNLSSLYNALDLRFGQKFSKDFAHLQMKTRHQKPEESLQEYTFEMQRITTLAFSNSQQMCEK